MQRLSPSLSSPSFGAYSCNRSLAEIAARVVEELRSESDFEVDDDVFGLVSEEIAVGDVKEIAGDDDDVFGLVSEEVGVGYVKETAGDDEDDDVFGLVSEEIGVGDVKETDGDDEEDDEFEFAFVCAENEQSPISADQIFSNGQIRPIFPLFNRGLIFDESENPIDARSKPPTLPSIRAPLRTLMYGDRDSQSCSSSEADDLEGVSPGTYCVWTPRASTPEEEESPGKCKKSSSTGSSKRWKFRDILRRSNSDGKDAFVFLAPSNANPKSGDERVGNATAEAAKVAGKSKATVGGGGSINSKMAATKEGERRKSYLPYRQDLVGFFANVNGLNRNLHPF